VNTTLNWKNLKEVVFLIIGVFLIFSLRSNDVDLDRNYKTNLQSRAEDCRLQLGLGIPLGEGCLDPEMKPYFDKTEHITTAAFRAACENMRRNNQPLQEGCPDGR
jgi:hypothetical protein